jgi:DNA-binding NarL/FixJ family response regulator
VTVRVAILDDNGRFRQRLIERLRFFPEVAVAFDAASAEDFLQRLRKDPAAVDVALLDIGLPERSGIDVAAEVCQTFPAVGILMFTVFEAEDTVLAAIQAGASGYLLKDAPAQAIVQAVSDVHEGGVPLSRPIARRVLKLLGAQRDAAPAHDARPQGADGLSPREIELLQRIVQGETEAEIAQSLGLSPHTVRTHVKNIYRKLRVRSRAAAVRLAYERRLLPDPSRPR